MSQLNKILVSSDLHHTFPDNLPKGVVLDIDRSGSISVNEIYAFLDEISLINDNLEKTKTWLAFNQKIRQKGKETKIRVRNKQTAARFKLTEIKSVKIVFTDGEG